MPANLENSLVATGLEKVSFHSNPKERQCQRMLKLPHNCTHLNASKVMLKILQARLQQYMNRELPDVPAGFRKGRGTRDQIANICWIMEKVREFHGHNVSLRAVLPLKPQRHHGLDPGNESSGQRDLASGLAIAAHKYPGIRV